MDNPVVRGPKAELQSTDLAPRNVSLGVGFNPREENDMTKTRLRYTLEFKQEAVRLVNGGQSQASVARDAWAG